MRIFWSEVMEDRLKYNKKINFDTSWIYALPSIFWIVQIESNAVDGLVEIGGNALEDEV